MDWGFLAFLADGRFVAAWQLAGAGAAVLAWRRAAAGRRGTAAVGALAFPPLGAVREPGLALAAPAFLAAMGLARTAALGFAAELWLEFLAFAAALLFGRREQGLRPSLPADGLLPAAAALAAAGTVTGVVTPLVVGAAPPPDTFAFWGFGALALAVALPAAALAGGLVRRFGPPVRRGSPAAAGAALLALALVSLPAIAHQARLRTPIPLAPDVVEELEESNEPLHRLEGGALATAAIAGRALREGDRSRSAAALEASLRAAAVVEAAGGRPGAAEALSRARRHLQNGEAAAAFAAIGRALLALQGHAEHGPSVPGRLSAYRGAPVLDAQGLPIGRVIAVEERCLALALHPREGAPRRRVGWAPDAVVLGGGPGGGPLVAVPEFGPEAGTGPASGCRPTA